MIADRYALDERLGAGGMGDVWGGTDLRTGTPVAVKLIKEDLQEEPEIRVRFHREASIAAGLAHPNIVTIHDVGEDDGILYLVMERLAGPDLLTLVRTNGALPFDAAVDYLGQAAAGLAAAHAAGVVHKDVKPENLMLDGHGVLKILDFGIARVNDATEHTASRTIGSYLYWAPERLDGQPATALSDLYSLGCVAMTLLTTKPPFTGEPARIMGGHLYEAPARVRDRRPDVPPALDELTASLLAKRAQDRWPQTAQEVVRWTETHPHGIGPLMEATILRPWNASSQSPGADDTRRPPGFAGDTMLRPPPVSASPQPTPAPSARSRTRWVPAVLGVAAVALIAGGVVVVPQLLRASEATAGPGPRAAASVSPVPGPEGAASGPAALEPPVVTSVPTPVALAPVAIPTQAPTLPPATVTQAPPPTTKAAPAATQAPVTITQAPVTVTRAPTTTAARPRTPTLAVAKGAAGNNAWCISPQCRAVVVSGGGFAPNTTYLISYHATGGTCPAHGSSTSNPKSTSGADGSLRASNYYYDCAGATVWVTIADATQTVTSNKVTW